MPIPQTQNPFELNTYGVLPQFMPELERRNAASGGKPYDIQDLINASKSVLENRKWQQGITDKMTGLIDKSKGGDAQAIWDLTRIQEAGNMPAPFFDAARNATQTGQGIISQQNRNWFLQNFPQYSRFMDAQGNLQNIEGNYYRVLRGAIPTIVMSPQSQSDYAQSKRNQLVRNLMDDIYERQWREAHKRFDFIPTMVSELPGANLLLKGIPGASDIFSGLNILEKYMNQPNTNLTQDEQNRAAQLKTMLQQQAQAYDPWTKPPSLNPFTQGYQYQSNNPFARRW